jgi:hypothetical protein
MTEAEALEVIAIMGANGATYFTTFTSFTFAYLTVAYFVGASLTRFQCIVASVIYIFSAGLVGGGALVYVDAYYALRVRERTIMDESWIGNVINWPLGASIMLVSMLLVSLYFMYDVRNPKRDRNDT